MSREALQLSFGGPNALEAFAAMLLGERPFDPSPEAHGLARIARELADDVQRRGPPSFGRRPGVEGASFRVLYCLARERAVATVPPRALAAQQPRNTIYLRVN